MTASDRTRGSWTIVMISVNMSQTLPDPKPWNLFLGLSKLSDFQAAKTATLFWHHGLNEVWVGFRTLGWRRCVACGLRFPFTGPSEPPAEATKSLANGAAMETPYKSKLLHKEHAAMNISWRALGFRLAWHRWYQMMLSVAPLPAEEHKIQLKIFSA